MARKSIANQDRDRDCPRSTKHVLTVHSTKGRVAALAQLFLVLIAVILKPDLYLSRSKIYVVRKLFSLRRR